MEIIPVIDIMKGIAVHGKSGNRETYKPLKTVLCNSSNPIDIIEKYKKNGAEKVYIADLDAIMKKGDNFDVIRELPLYKIVDVGVSTKKDIEHIKNLNICNKLIVGTETLNDLDLLRENDIILSLDFKDGRLLNYELEDILNNINNNTPLIILDISSVGTQKGINKNLITHIIDKTNNPIYIGGGIKDEKDLKDAYDLGAHGVLIATAIHKGILNLKEIIEKYR
ncbi:HisA/HisF family protein [Methanothermococcus okinawensis]|uniref:HisA/hisF family protein n=1 Tax=Methanothermococcus okinawensis (strain DSM 14208 / JCM 11175 / IH1) TaxID=647113 RepID=F8AMA4_METOI|nr:HisA/HisF family protein [Methanothermococcus okinawensis]AEH06794.1 hisA/hisF family protein [Methanothermococcus okinawensis IH1]